MNDTSKKIIISAFPTLKFSLLSMNSASLNQRIFDIYGDTDLKFFYFGRSAIWNIVKLLRLEAKDNILMPSYHCSVEVEAVYQAGARIKFFEIENNMNANLDDLKEKIDSSTRAIFIIHYFGFPQPIFEIKKICMERGLYLIEDCAHAFLSKVNDKPLGTYGNFGILSMQKFLPLPNGGVLLTNAPIFRKQIDLYSPNRISVMRNLILLLLRHIEVNHNSSYQLINLFFVDPLKKGLRLLRKNSDLGIVSLTSVDFSPEMSDLGMSEISKRILANISLEEIITCRRDNYNFLLECLKDLSEIKICFPYLPNGACPYFLPIEIKDRDQIYKDLLKKRISTFIFGEFLHRILPRNGFDTAKYLSKNVLALPIHQDLKPAHLEYMADNLKKTLI